MCELYIQWYLSLRSEILKNQEQVNLIFIFFPN